MSRPMMNKERITKDDILEWLTTGKINGVGYDEASIIQALKMDGAKVLPED